jgi:outer membrane protein
VLALHRRARLGGLLLTLLARAALAEPLTLRDAIERACRVDPGLASARVSEDRAKLAVLRAQLDRVSVTVDGSLQLLWNRYGIGLPADQQPNIPAGQGLSGLSANLNVPLFSGLRVESAVAQSQKLEQAQTQRVLVTRRELALSVARAYWAVRRSELLADAQQQTLARLTESEAVVATRVSTGLAPPVDLNRAKLRRLQTEGSLAELRGQVRQALAQLAVALNVPGEPQLVDQPRVQPLLDEPLPSTEALLDEARRERAELRSARLQVEAQAYAVRIARAGYFPQLSAFSLLQVGNNPQVISAGSNLAPSALDPFSNMSLNITAGAALSINFFGMLNTYTSTRAASYELSRLEQEELRAARALEAEVRTGREKVAQLVARRRPLVEALAVARDNLAILQARYAQGSALVIELLDSQLELSQAELNLSDVDAQLTLSWLELQAARGLTLGEAP